MAGKVECSITVDVEQVKLDKVTHLSVGQRMDAHHTFEFRMVLDDARQETFTGEARKYLGKKAMVMINFAESAPGTKDFAFEGIVTDVGFSRSQGGSPEITVGGQSVTFLLDDGARNRSFSAKGLAAIVDEVCKDIKTFSVSTKVKPAYSEQLTYVVQYEESNYQFLARMAARYGEWFFFDGNDLVFGKPDAGKVEDLVFGSNLFSLDIGLVVRRNNFTLKHWDHKNDELLAADSGSITLQLDDDDHGKLLKQPRHDLFKPGDVSMVGYAADKGDLDARATARKRSTGAQGVVLRGVSDHARLCPGKRIKVSGPIAKEGTSTTSEYGEFIVTSVSHSSSNGNYQNNFEAVPAANEMLPNAAAMRQPVCDPQPALVMEVDDPDKQGRVRVQFLWQKGGPELSPWIRVLSSHAHASGGMYLIPEVGDEVLVDFEFNDPEQPYVAGSLYNGRAKPDAAWADDRNEVKAFRTKGGNEVVIIDKAGKESITIRNKDGKNEVTLALGSEPSITIKTDGKLTLDAKTIELKCQDLEVDAKAGGKIKTGSKLDMSSANLKIDGSALVEVKGGLIKLN